MSAPKRGPLKVDLIGADGKGELDVQWNPLVQKYVASVRDGRTYQWTAAQFAAYIRKWLLRQSEF